jgi:hypothetical protein
VTVTARQKAIIAVVLIPFVVLQIYFWQFGYVVQFIENFHSLLLVMALVEAFTAGGQLFGRYYLATGQSIHLWEIAGHGILCPVFLAIYLAPQFGLVLSLIVFAIGDALVVPIIGRCL